MYWCTDYSLSRCSLLEMRKEFFAILVVAIFGLSLCKRGQEVKVINCPSTNVSPRTIFKLCENERTFEIRRLSNNRLRVLVTCKGNKRAFETDPLKNIKCRYTRKVYDKGELLELIHERDTATTTTVPPGIAQVELLRSRGHGLDMLSFLNTWY